MGGRGSQSPWAKQHATVVTQKALNWARSKIGSRAYGRWAWNGFFSLRERRSAICLSSMLLIKGIPKTGLFLLPHQVIYWLRELAE